MSNQLNVPARPEASPDRPYFSSGPCAKHPGWNPACFATGLCGRSHRSAPAKTRLQQAIDRSMQLLGLPKDWKMAIVPASDTGALELALWSLLGARPIDVFVWDSFSNDWAKDIEQQLTPAHVQVYSADYGRLPDMKQARSDHDLVFVYNGTTSGVKLPDLDWIAQDRQGLAICDATSAVFAMEIDYSRLDVLTWSWQKALGGEGGFGMLALSPRAVERAQTFTTSRPLPKIFRITRHNVLDHALFQGATINTPSLLALEDLFSALDWAESIGGLEALIARSRRNFAALHRWVQASDWIDWLAQDASTRSNTSMCLQIVDPLFNRLDSKQQWQAIKGMCARLEQEKVAYDIAAYRSAPPGFRIWGGATVETDDIERLLPWLAWAYQCWQNEQGEIEQ